MQTGRRSFSVLSRVHAVVASILGGVTMAAHAEEVRKKSVAEAEPPRVIRQTVGTLHSGSRNRDSSWRRPHEREALRMEARKSGYLLHQVLRDPVRLRNFRKRKSVASVRRQVAELKGDRITFGE